MAVDDVVQYKFGEKSLVSLLSSGFSDVTFKSYNGYIEKDSQQKYLLILINQESNNTRVLFEYADLVITQSLINGFFNDCKSSAMAFMPKKVENMLLCKVRDELIRREKES